jgi:hypothetical protein
MRKFPSRIFFPIVLACALLHLGACTAPSRVARGNPPVIIPAAPANPLPRTTESRSPTTPPTPRGPWIAQAPTSAKQNPAIAVIVEDSGGRADSGEIQLLLSRAEAGLAQVRGVTLINRSHLEKILAEQGLAYRNIVNDRARLGRLLGADLLLVVDIMENLISRRTVGTSAYGFSENSEQIRSEAALAARLLEIESGRILAHRRFAAQNSTDSRALETAATRMESALAGLSIPPPANPASTARHKISMRPTSGGAELHTLDLFIDGNFIGNTPIITDVEEGVREISLRRVGKTLWSHRVQVTKETWLAPEVGQ